MDNKKVTKNLPFPHNTNPITDEMRDRLLLDAHEKLKGAITPDSPDWEELVNMTPFRILFFCPFENIDVNPGYIDNVDMVGSLSDAFCSGRPIYALLVNGDHVATNLSNTEVVVMSLHGYSTYGSDHIIGYAFFSGVNSLDQKIFVSWDDNVNKWAIALADDD